MTRAGKPSKRVAGKGGRPGDPQSIGTALSQLFALKGYASVKGDAQLAAGWKELAGERIAERTAVLGVNRGVLQVGVSSAAMLSELVSFHKPKLVEELRSRFPDFKLRDIKFRLRGDLATRPEASRESAPSESRKRSPKPP
jgi:Dna[CI] antecedent, DciA